MPDPFELIRISSHFLSTINIFFIQMMKKLQSEGSKKEVKFKCVLPMNEEHEKAELFQEGDNYEFKGLRPTIELDEEDLPVAATRQNIIVDNVN